MSLDIKMGTLADCLKSLKVHPERISGREAVVFISADGSRTSLTFRKLYDNSVKATKSFIAFRIRKSEHVALSLNTCANSRTGRRSTNLFSGYIQKRN